MLRSFLRNLLGGPIAVQLRRYVIVGSTTAGVQMLLLWLFVDAGDVNYLLGATVAIEITIVMTYVLNNAWTFASMRNTGWTDYLTGLLKTNVVRGTAIPIQLAVLYALVDWQGIQYLLANAVAILVSGVYRYFFDVKWTWGRT
ncbi:MULTISPECIES: GtrA family protein [Halolamina]|uniref:Putative flippase GtrA (Transmembrane translocase of bactoprenol-linked glucose) n=1 Tax=Halolamina pelagica TaxID=699431 RepID=A0A1I5MGA4_9EURY|nr:MULTISPECIES: GtrA family protein [Halolamina]NHX36009.1 GtrA family protein [Halolamina sp. R1-12]SFP08539.1 Putative flippase GtrA (transmembrane translocase of bactoprenol-linked glucose) [Halolamina pelagica]